MLDVLTFANAAAAVSCTRLGAMNSAPTLAEVELMLAGEFVAAP
jgi:sugar/nucleoside kinase (ribokinase family)